MKLFLAFWKPFILSLGLLCGSTAVYAINSEFADKFHNCALKSNGSLACWGKNDYGQSTPPAGNDFTQLSVGEWHTCALKDDGSLACWGKNDNGQSMPPTDNDFTQVSAGKSHTCALKSEGSIACWGDNGGGKPRLQRAMTSLRLVLAVRIIAP